MVSQYPSIYTNPYTYRPTRRRERINYRFYVYVPDDSIDPFSDFEMSLESRTLVTFGLSVLWIADQSSPPTSWRTSGYLLVVHGPGRPPILPGTTKWDSVLWASTSPWSGVHAIEIRATCMVILSVSYTGARQSSSDYEQITCLIKKGKIARNW